MRLEFEAIPAFERVRKTAEGHEAPPPDHPRGSGDPVLKAFCEATGFPLPSL
jgi:hypothetical protein